MMHSDLIKSLKTQKLIIIVGNYGSGKTEVAVNLAFAFRSADCAVTIADLDVVNPYFRCREQREAMEAEGIRVAAPSGVEKWADTPIIIPEIKGMAQAEHDGVGIFDVGGDDVGATVLSSLRDAIGDRSYQLLQVVNTKRPFTDSPAGIISMKNAIENKSRLKVSGFVANSHLMGETDLETIQHGIDAAKQAALEAETNLTFVAVMSEWADEIANRNIDLPILVMKRRMLPPWKVSATSFVRGFGPPNYRRAED